MNSKTFVIVAALVLCTFVEVDLRKMVLTTGKKLQYQCFPFGANYLELEARATNDITILLSNVASDTDVDNPDKQFYKIVYGGLDNTQSSIAKDDAELKVVAAADKIETAIFVKYWIDVNTTSHVLSTGRGTNSTPIMKYADANPPSIHYFCISTDVETSGRWFIDTKYIDYSNSAE